MPENLQARIGKRFLSFALLLCSFVPQCLCGYEPNMQNKPNFKTEVRKQNTDDSKIRAKSTHKLRFSPPINFFYNCRESSTNHPYFLQNKPNFQDVQMNITSATTVNYINKLRTTNYELIIKTNPIKANFKKDECKSNNSRRLTKKTSRKASRLDSRRSVVEISEKE